MLRRERVGSQKFANANGNPCLIESFRTLLDRTAEGGRPYMVGRDMVHRAYVVLIVTKEGSAATYIAAIIDSRCGAIAMLLRNPNSHLPECWLYCLVCPRRFRANLPSRLRPSLFGSD